MTSPPSSSSSSLPEPAHSEPGALALRRRVKDTISEPGPVNSCRSDGSKPHRLKKRSSSVPALENRSLMSDLERVREGRFLELEEDKRVIAGEEGGSKGVLGGGRAGTWTGAEAPTGQEGEWSCGGGGGGGGAGTGLRGEGPGVVLGWKRRRLEVAWWRGNWKCRSMG